MAKSKDITFGFQSLLSSAMPDNTLLEDLQKAHKRLETEILNIEAEEKKVQEQFLKLGAEMKDHLNGKFD